MARASLRCIYCGWDGVQPHRRSQSISQQLYSHPFRPDEIMCSRCCDTLPFCILCERRVPDAGCGSVGPTSKHDGCHADENFLYARCRACRSLGQMADFEASPALQRLVQRAVRFLSHLIRFDLMTLLPHMCVELETPHQLSARLTRSRTTGIPGAATTTTTTNPCLATTFGTCSYTDDALTPTATSGKTQNREVQIQIRLLNSLSPVLCGAFLCHELIHATILCLKQTRHCYTGFQPPKRAPKVGGIEPSLLEEGLCHLAAAFWLTYRLQQRHQKPPSAAHAQHDAVFESQVLFWLQKFFRGSHAEFSLGFKTARQWVEQHGWKPILQFLTENP